MLMHFSRKSTMLHTCRSQRPTPSISEAVHHRCLAGLNSIQSSIHFAGNFLSASDAEFTLEMNPGTVTAEKLDAFREAGMNRASFGVQTFNELSLKILARGHNAIDARKTFELLRLTGFENVSFDLIAGLPNQSLEDWSLNLDEAIRLDPEHLSLYILEVHEGTPLNEQIRSGRQPNPDDDLAGEMYELMQERLADAGYVQYEISNFAKPGFESKHNNKYWKLDPVYGFGVSAHSFDGNSRRWSNERDTNKYVSLIEAGATALATDEVLDVNQLSSEYAFLNLRLSDGLSIPRYNERFGKNLLEEYDADLKRLENLGFITISDDSILLTKRGMLFSNEVFEVFV